MDAQKTGTLIAQARQEKGMTQKELSQALHVSAQAVSKWERGLNFPDLSLLEPLGDCLGLTVSELLSGQRGEEPKEELLRDSLRLLLGQAGRKLRRWRRLAQVCLGVLLVLALGAAVYLNWQFAGTGRLPVGDSSSETSQLGAAQLVNNTYVETVNDGAESGEASGDALAQARIDRQNSRDQALELLDGVLEDVDSDSAAKQQAVEEASAIAQNILAESNVESLLEAKGYTDCVAYITAQECSVVLAGAVEEADTLIVQEVVMEQTGLTADKIKIIGTN